jgi:hypothetical protein
MIQLTHGSIFDKKCDLLIIPCNDHGGVTKWVFSDLKENGLPMPPISIPFGSIEFTETRGMLENAEVVGFAASVQSETNSSAKSAIIGISEAIYHFCSHNNIRQVNIPLLGSGAGGLSPLDSFSSISQGFSTHGESEVVLEVFIPAKDIFYTVLAKYSTLSKTLDSKKFQHPRVFISYAGDDKDNKEWVSKLTAKLRENGVDARLDRFNMKAGTDLPQWMTNEVIKADKVLLICDSNYMIKADIHRGGVGWETMIIQGDMLSQGDNKGKYIAIVREPEFDKGLPIYMKSKLALHWEKTPAINDGNFKELLYSIFDCDDSPELGEIPDFIVERLSKNKID